MVDPPVDPPVEPPADQAEPAELPAGQPAPSGPRPPRFSRRQVLGMAGAGAGGLVGTGLLANWLIDDDATDASRASNRAGTTTTTTTPPSSTTTAAEAEPAIDGARWSDPATWGGQVPGPGDVAVVDRRVVLDVDAAVAGVQIEPSGELVFDTGRSRTLASTGNVVVAGALRAAPQGPDVTHQLVFEGIDESAFVGDHTMEPVDTDVGLWVVGDGVLDLQGARKRAWTNLVAGADAGATAIEVADAAGWRVGDEVVVTPTEPTTGDVTFSEHHDRRTVTALRGTAVTLDRPLEWSHPAVTVKPGVTHHAEVLNLTRNVVVQGTSGGRAHLLCLAVTTPQNIAYVGLRHLGPQVDLGDDKVEGTVGRYSLHFHMGLDGSRGSVAEGIVAYDGGNHAFVAHSSNGVTFRDCIAHDQWEDPFWWDQAADDQSADAVPTHDLVYERCAANHIRPTERSKYTLSGFMLGAGRGNIARGCVASGVQAGDSGTAAFTWPAGSRDGNTWVFEDCVSHNNHASGIFFWQNNAPRTIIDRYTSYHDKYGIQAGAYSNLASYRGCTLYACQDAGLNVTAVSEPMDVPGETITFENLHIDQAGLTEYAIYVTKHLVDSDQATRFSGCRLMGGTRAQVGFPEEGEHPQVYEFTDCTFEGNAFWLADPLTSTVEITVRDAVHGTIRLLPAGEGGTLRREWNADVAAV